MNSRRKLSPTVEIKVANRQFKLHLELPVKWIVLILLTLLIYFMPEFWKAVQTAVASVP